MECRSKQKLLTDFLPVPTGNTRKIRTRPPAHTDLFKEASVSYVKKRRNYLQDEVHQYTLDAGQKHIGTQFCEECGMVYDWDTVSDCNLHTEYHNRFSKCDWFKVKYSQIDFWKKQNFSVAVDSGYLFQIESTTKSSLKQRLEEVVLNCVNVELGIAPELGTVWDGCGKRQLWGYVASSSKLKFPFIAAVIIVEGVDQVFCFEGKEQKEGVKKVFNGWFMGVNRIWVHKSLRRSGIATKVLDEVRRRMRKDCIVPRERIAFSELTDDGEAFASKFCSSSRILRFSLKPKRDLAGFDKSIE